MEHDILLYGSLSRHTIKQTSTDAPQALSELIKKLGLPENRIKVAMVNHRAVPLDTVIRPGDRVALFPREYPFFADWRDFWTERGE